MRIAKDQKIGGVSALDVRKLLRKYREQFREDWLEEALSQLLFRRKFGHGNLYFHPEEDRALRRKAAPLITGLLEEGFIELDEEETQKEKNRDRSLTGKKWYKFTERGHELCNATGARPVHRKNADEALQGFMERVRTVNGDDRFLYRITAVVLYDSYVRGAKRPADVIWLSKWNARSAILKSFMRLAGNTSTIPDEPISGSDMNWIFLVMRCSSFSSNANEL